MRFEQGERIPKRDTAAVLHERYGDFRENCFPQPSGGCKCNIMGPGGVPAVKTYDSDVQCKLPIEGTRSQ
ncbi:unnamed protein product [Gongylonema pulchrum]|uniref:Thyroglobulin type-1 domain-containing protein n=1 Tax=Gongylonema pulchrum TaxID=637853 RepID=A0A183DL14_9BILA|nr:unnamed protein product [Gongylonema pulchrum]